MKINTDSTWCKVMDEKGNVLIDYGAQYGGYQFTALMNKILSPSQNLRLMEHDGTYTLSKKGERILKEEIEKLKTIAK